MIRPPIVGAELWRRVMSAADFKCECFGSCGARHTPARQRAAAGGQHICGWPMTPGGMPLVVAPADPCVPAHEAVAMPETELLAWCARCYAGALATARRAAKDAPEPTGELFDPTPFRRGDRAGGQYRHRGGEVA
jgi:hypothetical protein